jgi:TRAP-type C4-dicarboxylate transport system permease small subunit
MLDTLDRAIRLICTGTYALGGAFIGLMMVHVALHVLFQYAFNFPLPGTVLFVSNYYMVVVTFLCLGAVELKDAHISVDLVTNHLPPSVRRFLAGVAQAFTATVFVLLTWQSLIVAEAAREAGTFELEYGLKIMIWPSYYIVPLGSALFALTSLTRLLLLVRGRSEIGGNGPERNIENVL